MATVTLHHGDCLEYMRTMDAGSVDAIVTDPPYGTTACKWDTVIPFEPMWEQLKRVIKPRGAIVLFGSQPFTSALVMSNPKWFKYCWTWIKPQGTNPLCVKFMPLKNTEDVCVFGLSVSTYNPQLRKGKPYRSFDSKRAFIGEVYGKAASKHKDNPEGLLQPITTLHFSKESGLHPTQKPVDLMEYLIRTYTNEGETVLDFTMGSGTTGVACVQTGRNFIGCEIDADYFAIAQRRIAEAQAQPLLFEAAD